METILSGIFGLLGVAVGFLLSEWKKREEDKKNQKNVRLMLGYEFDQNLRVLELAVNELTLMKQFLMEEYRDHGVEPAPEERIIQERQVKRRLAQELNILPFPEWRRTVWEGQMPLVAGALHQDEIKRVLNFYSELDRITEIRILIQNNEQEKVEKDSIGYDSMTHQNSAFSVYFGRSVDFWDRFDQTVKRIRGIGNPLAKEKRTFS